MATQAQRRQRPSPRGPVAPRGPAATPPQDSLRTAAQPPHDIIPLPVLIAIFVFVEILILWLMAPQFQIEWTSFTARRYEQKHQYAKAIPKLHKLANLYPNRQTFYGELGECYLAIGKYDEAIKYYEIAQSKPGSAAGDDPDSPSEKTDYNTQIGIAYHRKGDMANAEKYLKLGLAKNRIDQMANFAMGEIEFQRGNYKKASEHFKVVASEPGFHDRVQKYYRQIEEKLFGNLK